MTHFRKEKKNQGETVVLPAAHCCCRVKSQRSNLKRHVLARSTAGQGCFYLLIFLQAPKMFSWNMLMAGGRGGVLFITSHNLHSHTDRIQGLLSTGKLTAHVSPEECEGGVWISWHLQPASNLGESWPPEEGWEVMAPHTDLSEPQLQCVPDLRRGHHEQSMTVAVTRTLVLIRCSSARLLFEPWLDGSHN